MTYEVLSGGEDARANECDVDLSHDDDLLKLMQMSLQRLVVVYKWATVLFMVAVSLSFVL